MDAGTAAGEAWDYAAAFPASSPSLIDSATKGIEGNPLSWLVSCIPIISISSHKILGAAVLGWHLKAETLFCADVKPDQAVLGIEEFVQRNAGIHPDHLRLVSPNANPDWFFTAEQGVYSRRPAG